MCLYKCVFVKPPDYAVSITSSIYMYKCVIMKPPDYAVSSCKFQVYSTFMTLPSFMMLFIAELMYHNKLCCAVKYFIDGVTLLSIAGTVLPIPMWL